MKIKAVLLASVLGGVLPCQVRAADYYFVGASDGSLQEKSNYRIGSRTGDVPPELPGSEDNVFFNTKWGSLRTYEISAADTKFIASRVRSLRIQDSVVALTVAEDLVFTCAINGSDSTGQFRRSGKLIKRGDGAMTLASHGNFTTTGASDDYLVEEIEVASGKLYFPQNVTSGKTAMYSGILNVGDGATVYFPKSYVTTVYCDGIMGDGNIVKEESGQVNVYISAKTDRSFDFSGQFVGNMYCKLNDNARQTFSNASNDLPAGIDVGSGAVLGFAQGNTSSSGASSLGTKNEMTFSDERSTLRYVGQGGTTYAKTAYVNFGVTFDGGSYGGLVLGTSGYPWRKASTSSNCGVARLILQGEGAAENQMKCQVFNKQNNSTIMSVPLTLVKRGAGVWNLFGHASNYEIDSTVAVDEGTLRFNSLAPVGTICSLGYGTHPYDPDYHVAGTIDESRKVGYHIRLGGGTTAGTLEYVGTAPVDNNTRIIAVNGDGTLRNASAADFVQHGVIATTGGAHVLTLDRGADAGALVVGDITNGVGTLSVRKTGAGTVKLDGKLDFNGDLSVEEGRVIAGNPYYTYFRFTVKDNMADEIGKTSFRHVVRLSEFALYDADGNRLNLNLAVKPVGQTELDEGQVRYVQGYPYQDGTDVLTSLFDDVETTRWNGIGGWSAFDPDVKSTHLIIEMRLVDRSPRAVSFDYVADYSGPAEKCVLEPGKDYGWYVAAPRVYTLEGSCDGQNWDTLYSEANSFENLLICSKKWASSNGEEGFEAGAVRKLSDGKGFAFSPGAEKTYQTLANVGAVSVAAAASLDLRGNVAPLHELVIDARTGLGELVGATLAETGALTIVNAERTQGVVPGSLKSIGGYERLSDGASWPVTVKDASGKTLRNRTVSLNADGNLVVCYPGMVLIVR